MAPAQDSTHSLGSEGSAIGKRVVMKNWLDKANLFFDLPLTLRSRVLILVAVIALVPAFLFPLWNMTFTSNQYLDGLTLNIYSHRLEGGKTPAQFLTALTAFDPDVPALAALGRFRAALA